MGIKTSLALWLVVLAMVTQTHGATWSEIHTDVGNYPDTNTAPLANDLDSGVDPDTAGVNGWTALHVAAGMDKPNMAAVLKQKGANLNIKDSNSYTPLHVAVGLDHINVINELVPGANTEIKGPNQWTALHVAVGNDFADAIAALISNSADVNAADSNGWTPLHIAIGNGYSSAVQALLADSST